MCLKHHLLNERNTKENEVHDELSNRIREVNSKYIIKPSKYVKFGTSILDLIDGPVKETPDALAVVYGGKKLSFAELNALANQLARYLQCKGVKEGDMVPICMERSVEMIIGILGILKAGGAYVPIDLQYPKSRISLILEETKASVVLTHQQTSVKLKNIAHTIEVVEWEDIQPTMDIQKKTKPTINLEPHHLAYVIFTSGSTGKPKGVLVEHAALASSTLSRISYYSRFSNILLVPSFSFDASVGAIFGSLSNGDCLFVSTQDELQDPQKLKQILPHIDTLLCVPSYYAFLLNEGVIKNSRLSKIILGGENISLELVTQHFNLHNDIRLFNEYGPTEATVWSTVDEVKPDKLPIAIGRPIESIKAYILDLAGNLVPEGMVGELHIAGKGLARGYLNDDSLTQQKFIENPIEPGTTIYKTGDLAYSLPDGRLVYVGRLDEQVKINGHRIELGEIESILLQNKNVKQAVVLLQKHENGSGKLVAFIVPKDKLEQKQLREYLLSKLSFYMVPHIWVGVEEFPLTSNGKIDRQALHSLDLSPDQMSHYESPRNTTEEILLTQWRKQLGLDSIGIHDDFFELGGNSLLAMSLVSNLKKELSLAINLQDLFKFPSVAQFYQHLPSTFQREDNSRLIANKPRPSIVPLSYSQESLWFIDQLEGSRSYHLPMAVKIVGKVNLDALNNSLKSLLDRHEVLRSVIVEKKGYRHQYPLSADNWDLNLVDVVGFQSEERLQNELAKFIGIPFDLTKDFMLRATLVKVSPSEHVLVLVVHHMAFDAWSKTVLINDLFDFYKAYHKGKDAELQPLPIQYADYAIWQKDQFEKSAKEKVQYWKNKLDGVVSLQLPKDFSPGIPSQAGAVGQFLIPSPLVDKLKRLSIEKGATLFMTLLAGFKALLYRYSALEDVCVGTAIAGREEPETEGMIGYFINTLPLRTQVSGKSSFLDLLGRVKATTLEAFEHKEVPFEKVVAEVGAERSKHQNPLFQVMFNYQNVPPPLLRDIDGLHLSAMDLPHSHSKFELTFSLSDNPKGLEGTVEYRTDLYHSHTIENMISHYLQLLQSLVMDPNKNVGELNMLTLEEKHQLLHSFNPPSRPYSSEKNIIDLLEEQALKTPHRLALIFGEQKITYKQLDERSNQLAHLLRSKGAKEETLVLLCIQRSLEMVVGMLGTLKAGAAYVPIDPEYPQDRIKFIQEDTSATLVVSSKESLPKLSPNDDLEIILLDPEWSTIRHLPSKKAENAIRQDNLAYIIYTSGSTGKPKGVMIEHKNVFSFICWCREEFNSSAFEIVYAATSICFDLSIFEIFYPLSIGKRVRILKNGLEISQYLSQDSAVMINTVPSVVDLLLDEGWDYDRVSAVNMAGEPIPQKVLKRLDAEKVEARNLYGPTEDTTYSTIYRIKKDSPLLIGRPISNTRIYILSPENELNPVGVPGEICIAGSGLSRGYFNRKDLTDEKFVPNPFVEDPSSRIYLTGDIGRWVQGGQIEYLGRKDDQVKIRGFRIEMGEIEKVLQLMEGVEQAVVLAEDDHQGNKQLIGYLVYNGDFKINKIINYLKRKLPAFMVPVRWIKLDHMPLTPNGKIDKKALPGVSSKESVESRYVAPRTPIERNLALIWENLLQLKQIGIHDNFFRLGGHSLLATSLVSSIRAELEVDLRIKDIFAHPTIAGLSTHFNFDIKSKGNDSILELGTRAARVPASYNQESLWFIDKLNGSVPYHIPTVVRISGKVDDTLIHQALKIIMDRHEVLRTVITNENGNPMQSVRDSSDWSLSVVSGENFKNDQEKLQKYISDTTHVPFDLANDYMLRATLIHLEPQDHLLVLVLHHIASDGWSISVLLKELTMLLQGYENGEYPILPPLPLQYGDFSLWQRKKLQGQFLTAQMKYWKEKLTGLQYLQLPLDYPRPEVQSTRGTIKTFEIEGNLRDQLLRTGQRHEATLFMVLMAAFKVMLYRYSSQQDICVGTVTAGRQRQETEKLVGYFINPLPIRSWLDIEASFQEVLKEVKANSLEAFENQELPFDQIVVGSGTTRDLGRNPLFQVMFILQNLPQALPFNLEHVQFTEERIYQASSKFDLTFIVSDQKSRLEGTVEYCTDLFKDTTIDQMIKVYLSFLGDMVSNSSEKIKYLAAIPHGEQHKPQQATTLPKLNITHRENPLGAFSPVLGMDGDETATTPNEKLIAEIWGEALGVKNINIHDNFFEKGGHSLTAVQVMTHLEKQLGAKLPLSILFKFPTVHTLARALENKSEKLKEWNSLVPIKPEGENDPLYIIHGVGSNILAFYAIAKNMAPEQPVYGLQPKGLDGKEKPLTSVEAIASHFVDEIIQHNPKGPYCLAGYSFGGIIAYEMAKQLKELNREVKQLIMFDTIAYQSDHRQNQMRKLRNTIRNEIGKRWFDLTLLSRYPKTFKKLKINSLLRNLSRFKIIKLEREKPTTSIIKDIEDIHKEAARNYVIKPYNGSIHLLKAKIPTYYISDSKYLGWKGFVEEIYVRDMEGEHTTMFSPPHDLGFAKVLQEILNL